MISRLDVCGYLNHQRETHCAQDKTSHSAYSGRNLNYESLSDTILKNRGGVNPDNTTSAFMSYPQSDSLRNQRVKLFDVRAP